MAVANLQLLQAHPWHATPLGPMEQWHDDMRAVVVAALNSGFPICTAWGNDHVQIYNDAYNHIYGVKHPGSFGAPARESWPEIWEFLAPALEQVRSSRAPLSFAGMLLPLARAGAPQECYFDFSYSPVLSRQGAVLGVMSAAVECTTEVVARRRRPAESWSLQLEGHDILGVVAAALEQRIRDNAMDAWSAAIHAADGVGTLRVAPVWNSPPRAGARARVPCPQATPSRLLRIDLAASGEHAGYAHLLPVTDSRGRALGAITLVPSALVPESSHRAFCEMLMERLQAALYDAQSRRAELLSLRRDIGERERLYAFLFENMEDAAFYTATGPGPSDEEVILAANPRAADLSGYPVEALVGMRRETLFFEDDADLRAAVEARSRSSAFVGELLLRRKDGSGLPVEISARLVQIGGQYRSVSIVRDVSWRRAREKALADRARFEAMVELTGGIAHDFNNFLTVILGSLDALEARLPADGEERQLVSNAVLGAERAAALTDQLLTYAKRRNLQTTALRWKPFLEEIKGLLASTLGETSVLKIDVEPGLPECDLDAAQLTSALLNLAANARDAMPEGGTLTLAARRTQRDEPHVREDGWELPAGEYVELSITDTGTGIPPDLVQRVFEPFFTTKEPESGSGLGLAMVQGFVRQSGGDVRVTSGFGQGTRFQLLFPAGSAEAAPLAGTSFSPHGEIVLLVEDNEAVRRQTISMLRSSGLRVIESHDAQSALVQLRVNHRVDVLLANVTLPGRQSGVDLARTVRERWPDLAIVLTTGGARGALANRVESAGFRVMRKPFTKRDLVQAILGEVRGRSDRPAQGGR